MRPLLVLSLFIVALALSTGCASKSIAIQKQTEPKTAPNFTDDSERALLEAEVRHENAVNAELKFYAPLNMEQSTEVLKLARDHELKGLQSESIIASAKVINLLQLAEKNKTKVEKILQPILRQKKELEKLNCPQVLPSEFENQLAAINDLIKKIEINESVISKEKMQTILTDLKRLELDTLLAVHWQPAKDTLDKAKDENANNNAPKSYMFAEKLVSEAELEIRNNFSNRELVANKGFKALRSAQHALYLARDSEFLIKLDHQRAENAALMMVELLAKIGVVLQVGDVRHMALIDQANAIAQSAETQASRLIAPLQTKISELEKQLALATQTVVETAPIIEEDPVVFTEEKSE